MGYTVLLAAWAQSRPFHPSQGYLSSREIICDSSVSYEQAWKRHAFPPEDPCTEGT